MKVECSYFVWCYDWVRRILYIDGSNLFGGMSELLRPGEYFDFNEFMDVVETIFNIGTVKFYGTYRSGSSSDSVRRRSIIRAQYLFFNQARSHSKVMFVKGYFGGYGKEKGVDMKMGVDLVKDAYEGAYDEAIVLSGDDDFIYAISSAKATGK